MVQILQTLSFATWLRKLRDRGARVRMLARLDRLAFGNPGDVKNLGGGVSELRIDYGPGYRIYFARRGETIVLLLCGGDKSTQSKDIATAQALTNDWKD